MLKILILGLIRLYNIILSPVIGYHCRFQPTCSQYMQQAIRKHGTGKGLLLGGRRLLRCHPFCRAERDDPVP